MALKPTPATTPAAPVSTQRALLESLVDTVTKQANEQLMAFIQRMTADLLDCNTDSTDSGNVYERIRIGNLLQSNSYAFFHLASTGLERAIRADVALLVPAAQPHRRTGDEGLTLVPYEVMDSKIAFAAISRPFETEHADQLATLNVRLAFLLDRAILRVEQNPFRPATFLTAIQQAWIDFQPDADERARDMITPMLRVAQFIDLAPVYEALNLALMSKGVLPGSVDSYRIRKSDNTAAAAAKATRAQSQAALAQQLRQFLNSEEAAPEFDAGLPLIPDIPNLPQQSGGWRPSGADAAYRSTVTNQILQKPDPRAAKAPLLAFLNAMQQAPGGLAAMMSAAGHGGEHAGHQGHAPHGAHGEHAGAHGEHASYTGQGGMGEHGGFAGQAGFAGQDGNIGAPNTFYLPRLKQSLPKGSLSRGDENTIDLLSKIFETVFVDPSIPQETRELIQFMQIPVLKAALLDKNFFFQETHPARRMVDLLSRMGWEQRKSADDPVFQAMQRSVDRVGRDFNDEVAVFADAVSELEASIEKEESVAAQAIAEPIAVALKQEKIVVAKRSARSSVAMRIGTGDVVAVVETFLENKWSEVLTIAYSVEDEKPGAVGNATKVMDDLIWSVKPKVTMAQRKQLIATLPGMLLTLNKWLDIIKWKDADRLQFFANLAECHASIVRAPLDLTPERQLEIAVEVAKQDAQRSLAKQALPENAVHEEPLHETVASLERGVWVEFKENEEGLRQAKLAWVSPLRSLFIFSTGARKEAFSISAEKLAELFSSDKAQIIRRDGVVEQALLAAMGPAVNDDCIEQQQTAFG